MLKTNYKYYLGNGSCIEYDLSPDSDLVKVIDNIASTYVVAQAKWIPDQVLVSPEILSKLEKLFMMKSVFTLGNANPTVGFTVISIQSIIGPLKIVPLPDLEFPIFIGRHEEYKDNCFNALMEDVLNEVVADR